ncbi:unnamed protein product, partial [Sphacelaria rigidula]
VLTSENRSARLVILGGIGMLLSFVLTINFSCAVIWHESARWFWMVLILFGIRPILFGTYISRALRLVVVFHPRAKRTLPWLIPERNYLYVLACLGIAELSIPIYHEYTVGDIREVISLQHRIAAMESSVLVFILAALYPFIRKVDDIFSISRELTIVTAAFLVLTVGAVITMTYGNVTVIRWLGPSNVNPFITAFIFGISVVDPLRRMACDPLAATKRNLSARRLFSHRDYASTARTVSMESPDRSAPAGENKDGTRVATFSSRKEGSSGSAIRGGGTRGLGGRGFSARTPVDPKCAQSVVTAPSDTPNDFVRGARFSSSSCQDCIRNGGERGDEDAGHVWNFERLTSTPLLAAAFEEYSRKALCHESVLFLSANFDFSQYSPRGSGATSEDFILPSSVSVATSSATQFDAFTRIANTFIKAGAREEVNLSYDDKKRIMSWVKGGREAFNQFPEEERRRGTTLSNPYHEVRTMLEQNLLLRFFSTDEFKQARARRELNIAMMESPEPDIIH